MFSFPSARRRVRVSPLTWRMRSCSCCVLALIRSIRLDLSTSRPLASWMLLVGSPSHRISGKITKKKIYVTYPGSCAQAGQDRGCTFLLLADDVHGHEDVEGIVHAPANVLLVVLLVSRRSATRIGQLVDQLIRNLVVRSRALGLTKQKIILKIGPQTKTRRKFRQYPRAVFTKSQTCPNLSKHVQTCSDVTKHVTCTM